MGVYINGIEMPTGNDELRLIIRSNGQVIISHETYYEEAEAVPVPEHGRLIDADALMEIISKVIGINASIDQRNEATDQERRCLWWFEEQVNIAPTIIPAEEGER